jgi:hypothetical protein
MIFIGKIKPEILLNTKEPIYDSINPSDTQTTDPQNTDPQDEDPTACLYEDPTPPDLSLSSYELFDISFPIRPNGEIDTTIALTLIL